MTAIAEPRTKGKNLHRAWREGDFFPKIWESKACLGSRADVGGGDK